MRRRSRSKTLRPFNFEDTKNYVAFQLRHAGARDGIIVDRAVKRIFQASGGVPRRINQFALHALIQGAVHGVDTNSTEFMASQLSNHPLYDAAS